MKVNKVGKTDAQRLYLQMAIELFKEKDVEFKLENCQCHFPFGYGSPKVTYNVCTRADIAKGTVPKLWCATKVNGDGYKVNGKYVNCDVGCPGDPSLKAEAARKKKEE